MMLRLFFRVRKFLVYSKIWAQRTMSWISVLNSGMILFLVLSALEKYGIDIKISVWFVPLYLGIVVLMIFFGYIEDKAGVFREEMRASSGRNPHIRDIIERLDRIEKDIRGMKKKRR